MDIKIVSPALKRFYDELELCCDMEDRKDAIEAFASVVGWSIAEDLARFEGMNNSYYFQGRYA